MFDYNRDGKLDANELKDIGGEDAVEIIVERFDKNGDEALNLKEFYDFIEKTRGATTTTTTTTDGPTTTND